MAVAAFPACPRPNDEVVELLERALANARLGRMRAAIIIGINPVNECEHEMAGDLSTHRATALIGELAKTAHQLLK